MNLKTLLGTLWVAGMILSCAESEPENISEQLFVAAESGHTDVLDKLLNLGLAVDTRDACLFTPLMKAALGGHIGTVDYLLGMAADPNLTDKGGYSPLMLAASNNHSEIVRILLEAGAHVDLAEKTMGWTALIWATKNGHQESSNILLEFGASKTIQDFSGKSAQDWMSKNSLQEVRRLVMIN
ncbi:MAG TPA: hypothetical protein DD827_05295 [Gammaproteobacteria bacterium]|nr:hypothetical protein [Gammaproteobacteria bacterium]